MNEETIRRIVKEELAQNYNSGTPEVPPHRHDGVDNLPVEEKDIVAIKPFFANIVSIVSETYTVTLLPNPNLITFNGFAANNAGGGGASEKAIINGVAQLGIAYQITALSGTKFLKPNTVPVKFVQASNSMFIDEGNVANTTVSLSVDFLAYTVDENGQVLAKIEIIAYTGTTVTLQVTLASGWQIQGAFIFS